jgi:hypothetical protein
MNGAIPPLPQYVVMAWYLVKHRDYFTLQVILPSRALDMFTRTCNELKNVSICVTCDGAPPYAELKEFCTKMCETLTVFETVLIILETVQWIP